MDSKKLRQILRTTLDLAVMTATLAATAGVPAAACAQEPAIVEPAPVPPGHAPVIVEPPSEPPITTPLSTTSLEAAYERAALSSRSLRMRNVLIGSTVATAIGAALVFPAEFTQCGDTDPEGEMTLNRCSPGGKAMVLIGYPLILFGGFTMIGSGIALGVTNGKLRRLEQRASHRRTRAMHWDTARSGFVF